MMQVEAAPNKPLVSTTAESAPILLFGMPRSGTTWLGKIFDSHPDTLYRHEPDSFGRLNFMALAPEPSTARTCAEQLHAFVADLPGVRDTKIAATLPIFPKTYLSHPQLRWNRVATHMAKLQARLGGEARAHLRLPRDGHWRLVWKSIESLARLGTIGAAIPQARGVVILRHPCGYLASVMRGKQQTRFTDTDALGEDFGILEALIETPTAHAYGVTAAGLRQSPPVVRVAWQWALTNDKALAETADSKQFLALRYEDLCMDPLQTTRELFDWCGLAWHPQTERFLHASTHTHRERYYSVFKDPAKAANRWRQELPETLQHQVMDAIGHTRAGRMYSID